MFIQDMLIQNLHEVEDKIHAACRRCGRKRENIILIAVSKTKPYEMVEVICREGVLDFGENKVQELFEKQERLKEQEPRIRWHMIGHLQRNKVKQILGRAVLIHSVDSYRLAEQIQLESRQKDLITDILLEVNVASEQSKFGFAVQDILQIAKQISVFPNVSIKGLMTVAPYVENGEENRAYFRMMHELCVDIKNKNIDNVTMEIISMGMTNDYETAIEEGATHIRIGTGIFGERK